MRIIFFGTGKFGLPTLKKLLNTGKHQVVAVVTQPDAKKDRGWSMLPTPVRAYMEKAAPEVEVLQPQEIREPDFIDHLRTKNADIFVVVDYGQILNEEILNIPESGCINLHPSLLPKYRGAAPVNWAILKGEKETGITAIMMNKYMDAGSIITREKTPIGEGEKAPELLERLAVSGAKLLIKALDMAASGDLELTEQDETAATYAPKLQKKDGKIEWGDPAVHIMRKIKAMQPWPGAFSMLNGKKLKIFEARIAGDPEEKALPGAVVDEKKFIVKTGEGALQIEELQLEGKKRMTREEFLRGLKLTKDTVLGT